MLFRMYLRWVEAKGFKSTIVDFQPGDEAGIKSVTFTAAGQYAFGYLKSETGVHRLVRISPFNASGKRHTSFASVFVYPELDNTIEVDIEEKDLRIDVFRASGAGGQHVNKTSSAVRITHLPTGIVVQCQQEKSQHRNKDMAMKVLKSRIYEAEKRKQDERMQEIHDGKDDIAWGSQIPLVCAASVPDGQGPSHRPGCGQCERRAGWGYRCVYRGGSPLSQGLVVPVQKWPLCPISALCSND